MTLPLVNLSRSGGRSDRVSFLLDVGAESSALRAVLLVSKGEGVGG